MTTTVMISKLQLSTEETLPRTFHQECASQTHTITKQQQQQQQNSSEQQMLTTQRSTAIHLHVSSM